MSDIQDAKTASTASFVTALVFNAAVFGIELAVFTLIRPYFKSIYEPRTYVPQEQKRVKPLTRNMFLWPLAVFKSDYRAIIAANGLDAYFFVRFLRVMVKILLPIWIISWAVLMPVDSVKTSAPGLSGLDRFTFGNISKTQQARYAAHLVLVWGFTFWILYVLKGEMRHFTLTRQQHLIETTHAKSVQANTILITGIPKRYLTQDALYKLFNSLPGGVKKIWINRDLKELPDIYDRRLKAASKLESAETKLLSIAAKLRLKQTKASSKKNSPGDADVEAGSGIPGAEVVVPPTDRPSHKLGFLGLFGEKVDTIVWARNEIAECSRLLDEGRSKISTFDERGTANPEDANDVDKDLAEAALDAEGNPRLQREDRYDPKQVGRHAKGAVEDIAKGATSGVTKGIGAIKGRLGVGAHDSPYPTMNSAFVTFNRQIAAHLAVQVLAHHEPYRMSNRYIEVAPEDVIWANLNLNPYEQKVRIAISYAATAALILLWSFPVAFVGAVSNIHSLCEKYSWLNWICELPEVVVGIISGILPPVLLAVLMMLLPIVLRLLGRFEGIPKYTGLELSLMTRYFLFQVLHSFLIVTLSSGIIASLSELTSNPTSIPSILATNLPTASNFFLTYILLRGLTGVASGFLQIVRLIVYYVKLVLLGSTPRSVWSIKYKPGSVSWGTTFPSFTLLIVITLAYSIISPIINGLACAAFWLFYQLFKYLFLYVYQQPSTKDTGGLFYPKAIQHVFVGLYIQQICLAALFFLARNENNKASAIPQGALMIVLIILTAGFHAILNNSYSPLVTALPLSLQDRTYTQVAHPTHADKGDVDSTTAGKKPLTSADSAIDTDSIHEHRIDDHKKDKNDPLPPDPADAAAQDEEDSYGFAHPAASRPQRTVWIPKDSLGMYKEEERACREAGIKTGHIHAAMDEKGKVDVDGGPPDLIGEVM